MTKLGNLHKGDVFVFDDDEYRTLFADGLGNALVTNIKNGRTKKLSLDVDVEETEKKHD